MPFEIESRIELTKTDYSDKPNPIATPIEVEMANENMRQNDFQNVKPALTKLPPRDTEAIKLWRPMLRKRKLVAARSF